MGLGSGLTVLGHSWVTVAVHTDELLGVGFGGGEMADRRGRGRMKELPVLDGGRDW